MDNFSLSGAFRNFELLVRSHQTQLGDLSDRLQRLERTESQTDPTTPGESGNQVSCWYWVRTTIFKASP